MKYARDTLRGLLIKNAGQVSSQLSTNYALMYSPPALTLMILATRLSMSPPPLLIILFCLDWPVYGSNSDLVLLIQGSEVSFIFGASDIIYRVGKQDFTQEMEQRVQYSAHSSASHCVLYSISRVLSYFPIWQMTRYWMHRR